MTVWYISVCVHAHAYLERTLIVHIGPARIISTLDVHIENYCIYMHACGKTLLRSLRLPPSFCLSVPPLLLSLSFKILFKLSLHSFRMIDPSNHIYVHKIWPIKSLACMHPLLPLQFCVLFVFMHANMICAHTGRFNICLPLPSAFFPHRDYAVTE